MLCKELQFGDWIADNNGFRWQIIGVGDDYAYATFEGNEGDMWDYDDKLEPPYPIRLTEEILEKNRWCQDKNGDRKHEDVDFIVEKNGKNVLLATDAMESSWITSTNFSRY